MPAFDWREHHKKPPSRYFIRHAIFRNYIIFKHLRERSNFADIGIYGRIK
jgi:hypothetical protein